MCREKDFQNRDYFFCEKEKFVIESENEIKDLWD